MLAWVYAILFAAEVFLLVRNLRRQKGVGIVLILNVLTTAMAVFLMWYFDNLPGYGIMPGFAYFPEVFHSLCAAAVFTVLTFVTLLIWLMKKHK